MTKSDRINLTSRAENLVEKTIMKKEREIKVTSVKGSFTVNI
jgi:hypothetical protein